MKYAMLLASVGALLLTAPALAAPSHGHTNPAVNSHGSRLDGDKDRDDVLAMLDKEMDGFLHNPHCDPDDRNGPDGDRDDRAANNPGRGHHFGRCHNHPASP